MATYTGLFNKIKDKNFQLSDKLKLVRFAWCSNLVCLPNKYSVLIDVVSGLLVNRKKYQLSDDDDVLVWQCLYNILQSPCCSDSAESILVKPSLGQVIIEALQKCVHQTDIKLSTFVIGCCHRVITSPHLKYILTSKYDNLASLLSSVCQLCLHGDGNFDSTMLYSILSHVITAYSSVQSAHHNQKQVLQTTVDKLFIPAMLFCHQQVDLNTNKLQDDILNILFSALFNSAHREMYRRYLSTGKGGDKLATEGCRPLENLFDTMKNLLSGKTPLVLKQTWSGSDVVCDFIPKFLAAFLKVHDKSLCQKMVQHLCNLIGLNDSAAPFGQLKVSQVMRVVNSVLREVNQADIYNVAKDNEAGGPQLKFYRHVADVILAMPVEEAWYELAVTCLQMNHGILEPKMTQLLSHAWLVLPEQRSIPQLGHFLSELFHTYSRLRQMPKLFGFIMTSIQRSESTLDTLVCPKIFTKRFHGIVQGLPQTTSVDIWMRMVEEVKTGYLVPLREKPMDEVTTSKTACLLTLLRLYLSGIKMADYTITDVTARKVHQLMSEMETEILQPLYEICKKQSEDLLAAVLFLSYTWGELKLMLALYDNKYKAITKFSPATVSHPTDISLVHPYLTADKWEKLHKRAKKMQNRGLQYLFDLLSIQKVKAVLLFAPDKEESKTDLIIQTVVDEVISLPDDVTGEQCIASWDGEVSGIKGDNWFTSRWQTVTSCLPIITSAMSAEQYCRIAEFVVQTFSPTDNKSSSVNLASLTASLLMSPVAMESRKLQTSIISSLLKHLSPVRLSEKSPKKKRKLSGKVAMVTEGIAVLSQMESPNNTNSENNQSLKSVASLVTEVLSDEKEDDKIDLKPWQLKLLQMFEMLPLEFLTNFERIRCFFGLVLLASVANTNTPLLHLLSIVLDGVGQISVFQIISPEVFLSWVISLRSDTEFEAPVFTLLDKSCQTIVRDFHVVTQIQTFINKLADDLENCCDQLQQKTIHRASEMERAKFTLTSCLLKHLSMQLQKQSLPQVIRESYRDHFSRLSSAIIKVIKILSSVQSKKRVVSPSTHLIGCFTSVLHQSCVDLAKSAKRKAKGDATMETDQENENERSLNLEDEILESADFVLKRTMENIHEDIVDCGTASLEFIQAVCRHHQLLQTVLTSATVHSLWKRLMAAVTRSHDQQNPETSDSKLSDSASKTGQSCSVDAKNSQNDSERITQMERLTFSFQDTLATVAASCDLDLFRTILGSLVNSITPSTLQTDEDKMLVAMTVWEKLLAGHITEEQSVEVTVTAQHIMMNFQSCLEYSHGLSPERVLEQAIPILNTQAVMLNHGYTLIPRQTSVLCLHGCRIIPLEGSTYSSFIPACIAVQEVLVALMIHHPNAVLSVIPSYVANIKHLLVSVIQHGCQDRLLADPQYCDSMIHCANLVTRLCSLLEPHKVEFSKVVVYVLSDYAYQVQNVTLLPAVKKALLPGIYILLDIADRFQIAQLLMVLPHGTKEVFKLMYSDYTKYHKYSGKV